MIIKNDNKSNNLLVMQGEKLVNHLPPACDLQYKLFLMFFFNILCGLTAAINS